MTDQHELAGRVALVAGAARNMGRAIAGALAQGGAKVVVQARTSTELCRAKGASGEGEAMIRARGPDRSSRGEAHVDEVAERFGRLDTLIHNAAERADGQFESIAFRRMAEDRCQHPGSRMPYSVGITSANIQH